MKTTIKRTFCILLSMVLALSAFCGLGLTASAAVYSGTCGDDLIWTLDTGTGVLEISGTGTTISFSRATETPWFNYRSSVQTVLLSSSITCIGDLAISNCINLTSISIPDGVTSIGNCAFSHCESLTSLVIPSSVTSIDTSAFSYCDSLTSITIPHSVTSIGIRVFAVCRSLTSITIPDSVTSIGAYAFLHCFGLTSVTIPDSVTSIGEAAFSYCTALTNIHIPSSVAEISNNAFEDCQRLAYICGDTMDCYARTYADAHNIEFRVCAGHGNASHAYSEAVTTEPTCTTDGVMTYTCIGCGDFYTEPIPALGHDYDAVVTEPTCTAEGYTTYTCTRCGDSYTDDVVNALASHSYGAPVWSWTAEYSATASFTCVHCGDTQVREAAVTSEVTTEPTYRTEGVRTYTAAVLFDDVTYTDTTTGSIPQCTYRYDPQTATILSENFDSLAMSAIPAGWESVGVDNSSSGWLQTWSVAKSYNSAYGVNNPTNFLFHSELGHHDIILPAQNLSEYISASLSFRYMNQTGDGGVSNVLTVHYRVNGGEWTTLFHTEEAHDVWTACTVDLPADALQENVEIAFYSQGVETDLAVPHQLPRGVAIDDVLLTGESVRAHAFSFSAVGNVLTAVCANEPCSLDDHTVIMTLHAPEADGSDDAVSAARPAAFYQAVLSGTNDFRAQFGADITIGTIEYCEGGTQLDAPPTAGGYYTVRATVTIYGTDYVLTQTYSIDHAETYTDRQEPTCTADGNILYAYCANCENFLLPADGVSSAQYQKITEAETVIPATGHAPAITTSGYYAFQYTLTATTCTNPNCPDSRSASITLNEPEFAWGHCSDMRYWPWQRFASIEGVDEFRSLVGTDVTVSEIEYYKRLQGETKLDAAPMTGGRYILKATVNVDGTDYVLTRLYEVNHIWNEKHDRQEPTCTENGNIRYYRCAYCHTISRVTGTDIMEFPEITEAETVLPALGHEWGDWVVTTTATTAQEGVETRTCTRCAETETRAIPCLPSAVLTLNASAETVYTGDTVQVTVDLTQNPGLIGMAFGLVYNADALTLTQVQETGMFTIGDFASGGDLAAQPYRVLWFDALTTENHTETGSILTFTFTVKDTAQPGTVTFALTVEPEQAFDFADQNVPLQVAGTSVTVVRHTPGDCDGDGELDLADVANLVRYLAGGWEDVSVDTRNADANADGKVNLKDVVLLRRYLAGWNVTLQ